MSTDYGFRCVTCNTETSFDNFSGWAFDELFPASAELASFWEARNELGKTHGVYFYLHSDYGSIDLEGILDWLVLHKGHDLVPVDEYGKIARINPRGESWRGNQL